MQVGFGQTCQAGFEIIGVDGVDVPIDLPCLCLSEGEAAVTKREGEGFVFHAVSLQGQRRSASEAVTVHPLSHAGRGDDGSRQDGTARDASEAILLAAATEANLNGASEGVAVDGTGAVAELRVDGEHGSFRG